MKRTLLVRIGIILALLLAVFLIRKCQEKQAESAVSEPVKRESSGSGRQNRSNNEQTAPATAKAPAYVLEVLAYVRANNEAPAGYVGGREFQNREKHLPIEDEKGRKIHYREWDVKPKIEGKNRGAERLVTGSDDSAWYTKDHYKSFRRVE